MDRNKAKSLATIVPPKTFPYCLVWTPIPLISWLIPYVGHMGLANARGVIMDFAGPYIINSGSLMFGNPARYIQLDPSHAAASDSPTSDPEMPASSEQRAADDGWDTAIHRACHVYQKRNYNFMTDNCHAFVAYFMNELQFGGTKRWNMVRLAVMIFFRGRYVSIWGFVKTWLPFLAIMAVGLTFGTWKFAVAWAGGVLLPLTAWFIMYTFCINRQAGNRLAQSSAAM